MRSITFIRHANANKADEGKKDIDRRLSDVGIKQAIDRRKKMASTKFDLVVSSPAFRAIATAQIVTNISLKEIIDVEDLYPCPYDGSIGEKIDALFNTPKLGYAPVSKYLAAGGGDVIMDWAHMVAPAIESEIGIDHQYIVIFGHAVCLPALAMAMCQINKGLVEELAELNLGECDGFKIMYDKAEKPMRMQMI